LACSDDCRTVPAASKDTSVASREAYGAGADRNEEYTHRMGHLLCTAKRTKHSGMIPQGQLNADPILITRKSTAPVDRLITTYNVLQERRNMAARHGKVLKR